MDRTTYQYYERLRYITFELIGFADKNNLKFDRMTHYKGCGKTFIFAFRNPRTGSERLFELHTSTIEYDEFNARVYVDDVKKTLHNTFGMIDCLHLDKPSMNNGYFASPFLIDMDKSADEAREYVKNSINKYFDKVWGNVKEEVMQRNKFKIKKVIFNDPATIVIWVDGTKTVVKAQDGETYDPEKGLALAISKKALGNEGNYYEEFKKWLPERNVPTVNISATAGNVPGLGEAVKALNKAAKVAEKRIKEFGQGL